MRSDRPHRPGRSRISILSGALVTALGLAALSLAPAASADTAPLPPVTTPTASADGLPTVQVNGVVWNQVVVGNTVYATGAFTKARPSGSALGVNETDRSNLLAYNLTTGALITSWAPTLNAQGLTIAAAPDGKRIYVGGDFTTANGTTRNRIAAFDATTGALVTAFGPGVNGRVRSLEVTADTVYVGGSFNSTGGQGRLRLAAFATSNGALRTWNPSADQEVMALTVVPGLEVVVGGHFTTIGGTAALGMAAVDLTTGAQLPWAVNTTLKNYGPDAAIWSLSNDGTNVYGTGYGYLVNNNPATAANLENSFAATASGGTLIWANGCHGDTYGNFAQAGVLYTVGHPHECSSIGGHPQTDPWTFQRAMATTIARGPNNAVNNGGDLNGLPAPELLHWLPTLAVGSYTGQYQAAWTITGNSQYLVLGGEFLTVNGVAQQGIVRMPVTAISPNKQGPQVSATLTPTVVSLAAGRVRVSWQAAWDRDNRNLSYEVLRGTTVANSTVLTTITQDSAWWNRPRMLFNDTTAAAGSTQTYRIRVKDAFNNVGTSAATTFTVPSGAGSSAYAGTVIGDGATHLWRLGEPSGTGAYDWVGADDLTLDASGTRGTDGALPSETTAKSTTFSGTAAVPAITPSPVVGPQTFAVEAWVKTTSTQGGKIIGFGDNPTGNSSNYDRHVYMLNDGRLAFGVNGNGLHTVTSPLPYNDGQWHQVVGSIGSGGAELYVDGKRVGRDTGASGAQSFSGYWKIGGDNLGGWPNQPANSNFAGGIEEVAVYAAPLTLAQVRSHFQASGRDLNLPPKPTDAYGASVWESEPSFFWRLDEASGTVATDRVTNAPGGTFTSGVVLGEAGAPANPTGKALRFPGNSEQTMISTVRVDNPTVFSLETWFKTTSTRGGRMIGFGNAAAGYSSSYDRHIWMLNDGTLRYGIYTGNTDTVASPKAYNDGEWHQVVATQGSGGMQLFVDGALVGTGSAVTPQNYSGYWRLGSDNTWGGNDTNDFAGSLDEAAVYDGVLPATTVNAHWQLGKPASANVKPTAAFTSTVSNLSVAFDGSSSTDSDGTIAAYAWDFGDGTTGTGANPTHAYAAAGEQTVKLTVTDNLGAMDTVTRTVTTSLPPNVKPTAAFSSTCTDLACSFDASGSADPDGTIASYAWDFGDGSTSATANPNHTFTAGTYAVKLTVTDNRGGTDSITQSVTVAAANQSPVASFTSSTTNLVATFNSSASTDPDGTIASRSWDFGDGATSTATNPSHTYTAAGTYTVVLTVTDNRGATASSSTAVTVTAPANQLPTAAFSSTCTNLVCAFNSSASTDPDGTIASRSWDFGDGSTSTATNPNHTFAAGTYAVTLTVTDNRGGTASITQSVTVAAANQSPVASFTSDTTNLVASFDSSGSVDPDGTIAARLWDFGDGSTSTATSPSHTYATAGTYTVALTVTDNQGATGTTSRAVTVTAASSVLAADTFTRTVANGLGTAETGGTWTLSGAATNFAVGGGVATLKMPTTGLGITGYLNGVSSTGTDTVLTATPDKVVTGNGAYVWVVGRKLTAGEYRGRVRLLSTGGVAVQVSKYVSGTETVIGSETTISGLTYTAGTALKIRLQVEGSGTSTLRLKVWRADGTEPATWQKTGTDATAGLQSAGAVGLATYLSGSATNAPVSVTFDDLFGDSSVVEKRWSGARRQAWFPTMIFFSRK